MFETIDFGAIAAQYMPRIDGPAVADAPLESPAAPPEPQPTFAANSTAAPEWQAALKLTATADYGELPFGEFMDPHQGVYDAAAAAGLDQEGVGMMQTLAMQGQLDRMGPINRSFGEEIVSRLQTGAVNNDLAKTLMNQIIDPDNNIQQIGNHACVAATNQKAIATLNPALYFITAADIVNTGSGNLPSGETVTVSGANVETLDRYQLEGPVRVDAAFQAALMDHANGADSYDLETDTSTHADGRIYTGLNEAQAAELNSDVLNAPTLRGSNILADFTARSLNPQYLDLGEWGGQIQWTPPIEVVVSEHLQAARAMGFPGVFVPLADAEGNRHMVLVREMNDSTGKVTVMDASGASRQMDTWAFLGAVALQDTGDNGIGTLTGRTATGTSLAGRLGVRR